MKAVHIITIATGLPLLLQACAYQRPAEVTEQMARTGAVLEQAESGGAAAEALPELQQARDKYADAREAFAKVSESGDREALRLARQAEVDAKYAAARTQAQRQIDAAQEVQDGLDTLRFQTQREAPAPAPVN